MKPVVYEPVKLKYGLPSFSELDLEFEISSVEEENWVLRNVCKKIREKIEASIDFAEKIIQPDANCYVDLYECKFFSASEKESLLAVFKQLMHSHRTLVELDLLLDEKAFADFVKRFYSEWPQLKKALLPFLAKLKNVWKEERKGKERLEYLG